MSAKEEPKITIRIDGMVYEMPDFKKLTLGEARTIKQVTRFSPAQAFLLPGDDPDLQVALIWLVMSRKTPGLTVEEVERLEFTEIEIKEEGGEEPGPPGAGADEEPAGDGSNSGTIPETPGNPSSLTDSVSDPGSSSA